MPRFNRRTFLGACAALGLTGFGLAAIHLLAVILAVAGPSDVGAGRSASAPPGTPPAVLQQEHIADPCVAKADRRAVRGTFLLAIGRAQVLRMTRCQRIDTLITADEKVVQPAPVSMEGGRAVRLRGLTVGITRITLVDASGTRELYRVIVVTAQTAAALRTLERLLTRVLRVLHLLPAGEAGPPHGPPRPTRER